MVFAIEDLIPHRPPMRLLDSLVSDADESTTCQVTLTEHSPFMRDGKVAAIVAMEYMAQCVAAYATLHPNGAHPAEASHSAEGSSHPADVRSHGAEDRSQRALVPATAEPPSLPCPQIGYLVGVRQLELMAEYFCPGENLMVTVKHVWGSTGGAQFQGSVERNGIIVASGVLTVFVPPEKSEGQP